MIVSPEAEPKNKQFMLITATRTMNPERIDFLRLVDCSMSPPCPGRQKRILMSATEHADAEFIIDLVH